MTKKELEKLHGTPEQFNKAIWKAHYDLFISYKEAIAAITSYQNEYEAAK